MPFSYQSAKQDLASHHAATLQAAHVLLGAGRAAQEKPMLKKYMVRLTHEKRETCDAPVDKLKGSSQKVRCARILLRMEMDGPRSADRQVAGAFRCRTQTVESVWRWCAGRLRAGAERESAQPSFRAEHPQWRARGAANRAMSGPAAGLRELDAAAAGATGRGVRDHRPE